MNEKEILQLKQELINTISHADFLIEETHNLKLKVIENETALARLQLEITSIQEKMSRIEIKRKGR